LKLSTNIVSKQDSSPAISDYALIGDCRTVALVSKDGSIDWLCLPNASSASGFAKILDPYGGCFSLRPDEPFEATRRYIGDTAVLETTFSTKTGTIRVLDCLPVLDGIRHMRPLREILRVVEGVSGSVSFDATIDLRPDYGRRRAQPKHRGRLGWCY
jgi:GH15 family glucan-1,4-alpha-glucosidase